MDDRSFEAFTKVMAHGSSKRTATSAFPTGRHDGLLVQEVGDELVVYDRERHQAHRLDRTAAFIWRHCDGKRSEAELAKLLEQELRLPADEEMVSLGLERLADASLLVEPEVWLKHRMSRRQMLVKLGLAGGIGLLGPVVQSITAPTPVMAQSPPLKCLSGCSGKKKLCPKQCPCTNIALPGNAPAFFCKPR